MEQIFKVGQEVFDYSFGWGKVYSIDTTTDTLEVEFKDKHNQNFYRNYDCNGSFDYLSKAPILSTTKYTLNNFSQKEQFDANNFIGKWCRFWDNNKISFAITRFEGYESNSDYPYISEGFGQYQNFKILTKEQIKFFGLE